MAKHQKLADIDQLDESQVTQIERAALPETDALQKKIIAATKGLPQHLEQFGASDSLIVRHSWLFRPSTVAAFSLCMVAVLSAIVLTIQEPVPVDQFVELTEQGHMDELDWQDAILVYDEVAFAEY